MHNTSIWIKSQELAKFHIAFEEQMLWKMAAVRIVTCNMDLIYGFIPILKLLDSFLQYQLRKGPSFYTFHTDSLDPVTCQGTALP